MPTPLSFPETFAFQVRDPRDEREAVRVAAAQHLGLDPAAPYLECRFSGDFDADYCLYFAAPEPEAEGGAVRVVYDVTYRVEIGAWYAVRQPTSAIWNEPWLHGVLTQ